MNYLKIGFIKKPHGLKGELKVFPLTDNGERFKKLKTIFLYINNQFVCNEIQNIKITSKDIIIKLKNYNNLSEVENLRNIYVFVDRKDGIPCKEWEYYSQDLINCSIYYNSEIIGKVIDLVNSGANDNLLILYNGIEIYYPFTRDYIKSIDINKKNIEIVQIEGFFD